MEDTKVQIGDDCLLDLGVNSEWYISTLCYDNESVNVELRRKADRYSEWWRAEQTEPMVYPQVDGITPSVIQTEPQNDDEFKLFDREELILLIECQKERIAELLAKTEPNCSEKPNNCDEPQTYKINPKEPTHMPKCFDCEDFFTCDGQCNEIEDEPQTEDEILREQCRAFMGIVEQMERSE